MEIEIQMIVSMKVTTEYTLPVHDPLPELWLILVPVPHSSPFLCLSSASSWSWSPRPCATCLPALPVPFVPACRKYTYSRLSQMSAFSNCEYSWVCSGTPRRWCRYAFLDWSWLSITESSEFICRDCTDTNWSERMLYFLIFILMSFVYCNNSCSISTWYIACSCHN